MDDEQTVLVMIQRLNPYLILPKVLRPKKFDYHVLPTVGTLRTCHCRRRWIRIVPSA